MLIGLISILSIRSRFRSDKQRQRYDSRLHPDEPDVPAQPFGQLAEIAADAMRKQGAVDGAGKACKKPPELGDCIRSFDRSANGNIGHDRHHPAHPAGRRRDCSMVIGTPGPTAGPSGCGQCAGMAARTRRS
jgi:hypothetical protein